MPMDSGSFGFLLFSLDVWYNDEICSSSVYSLLEKRFPAFCAVGWQNLQLCRTAAEAYCLRHYFHLSQCFSFGSMSAKYARTCSGGHASFDMCGTRNASSASNELYANFPSV